jgi:hypothetical protein
MEDRNDERSFEILAPGNNYYWDLAELRRLLAKVDSC